MYDKHADTFEEKIASLSLYHESYDYLLDNLSDHFCILDLGCGPGNISRYLKKKIPTLNITGVDMSKTMISIAQMHIPDGQFRIDDICRLKLKRRFECVVCGFAIPFLDAEQISRAISVIAKHLKPDGYFYLSFIEGTGCGYEKTAFTADDPLFFYRYTHDAIMDTLAHNRLTVIKEFEIDFPEMDGSTSPEIVMIGTHL